MCDRALTPELYASESYSSGRKHIILDPYDCTFHIVLEQYI